MSYADNTSTQWVKGHGWRAALAAASLALVVCATVSAAEPPVTGKYQPIFKGYAASTRRPVLSRGDRPTTPSALEVPMTHMDSTA
jgi:hypothetical protein